MSKPLTLLLALALVPAAAGGVRGSHHPSPTIKLTVSGEVRALGMNRIVVGGLRCAVPSKLAALAGRFVIGDPVQMSCRNGTMLSVHYRPAVAPGQSNSTVPNVDPPLPTVSPPTGAPTSFVVTFAYVTLRSNGTSSGSASLSKTSTTGAITSLDDSSITVNDLTCNLPNPGGQLARSIDSLLYLGETIGLSCYSNGAIAGISSVRTAA